VIFLQNGFKLVARIAAARLKLIALRRYYVYDVEFLLSSQFFKSAAVEMLCEVPAKNGATTGDERASVGPRARCGPFSSQSCAPTTPRYTYQEVCCLAHVSV
jgi:hypothetical protein